MAVSVTAQTLIEPLSTDWSEVARENTRRANQNDTNLRSAVEALQDAVPVQKIKSGATTFTPDADGLVTLPSGVVLPAMTTAQRDAIATPVIGQQVYNVSTAREETYTSTGWQGPIQALTTAQRTALSPTNGQLVVDITEGRLHAYLGGVWSPVGGTAIDVYAASGTWTKRAGAKLILVIAFGGGASGASLAPTSSTACWGGAGGARAQALFAAALLPGSVSVTVGAGGSPTTTSSSTPGPGGAGGPSSFGSYVIAGGGGNPAVGGANGGSLRGVPGTNLQRSNATPGFWTVNPTSSTWDPGQIATQMGVSAAGGIGATGALGTSRGSGEASLGLGPGGGAGVSGLPGGVSAAAGIGGSAFGSLAVNRDGGSTVDSIATSMLGGGTGTSRSGTGVGGDGGNGALGASATVGVNGFDGAIPGGGGGAAVAGNGYPATGGFGGRGEVIAVTWF